MPVREKFKGELVWEGVVHVFDLEGHPKATRAYAWSSPIDGSTKRRFFAVLQMGSIKSPIDAVRAAIVAEQNPSSKPSQNSKRSSEKPKSVPSMASGDALAVRSKFSRLENPPTTSATSDMLLLKTEGL